MTNAKWTNLSGYRRAIQRYDDLRDYFPVQLLRRSNAEAASVAQAIEYLQAEHAYSETSMAALQDLQEVGRTTE